MHQNINVEATEIAQFRYFNIQPKAIDITAKFRGINPTNSIVYSRETSTEVYFFRLNFTLLSLEKPTVNSTSQYNLQIIH